MHHETQPPFFPFPSYENFLCVMLRERICTRKGLAYARKLRAGVAVALKRSDYDQRAACAGSPLTFFCSSPPTAPFLPLLLPLSYKHMTFLLLFFRILFTLSFLPCNGDRDCCFGGCEQLRSNAYIEVVCSAHHLWFVTSVDSFHRIHMN